MEPLKYAGFWRRFIAYLIDDFILTLFAVFLGVIIYFTQTGYFLSNTIFLYLFSFLITLFYYAIFESSKFQATPGKKIIGIRVLDLEGNRINFSKAAVRHLSKILSTLFLGVGFLVIAFDTKKQGFHDKIAGCLVVRDEINPVKKALSSPGVKKKLLLASAGVLGSIVILLAAGFLILSNEMDKGRKMVEKINSKSVSEAEKVCEKEEGISQVECYIALSKKTNNTAYCSKLSDSNYKWPCIQGLAEDTGNSTMCNEIEDKDQQQYCIALAKKDLKECEKIESAFKDICKRDLTG